MLADGRPPASQFGLNATDGCSSKPIGGISEAPVANIKMSSKEITPPLESIRHNKRKYLHYVHKGGHTKLSLIIN